MKSLAVIAFTASISLLGRPSQASEIIVTDGSGLPSATSWGYISSENTGGGSTVISGTAPRDGNGSVELRGDRTRFQLGIQYGGASGATNLMSLSSVTGLVFDWNIAADSISGYNTDYTPALRLLVQDGNQRSELIWEGVYNNTYGNTVRGTWYSSSFTDNFYQYIAGSGVTTSGGSQVNKTVADWISQNYSPSAFLSGISVGDGSGAKTTYHAFVDNVTLATTTGTTTYNFEVAAAAVPEPASLAVLFASLGLVGVMRPRRTRA